MQRIAVTGWETEMWLLRTANAHFLDENLYKCTVNIHQAGKIDCIITSDYTIVDPLKYYNKRIPKIYIVRSYKDQVRTNEGACLVICLLCAPQYCQIHILNVTGFQKEFEVIP